MFDGVKTQREITVFQQARDSCFKLPPNAMQCNAMQWISARVPGDRDRDRGQTLNASHGRTSREDARALEAAAEGSLRLRTRRELAPRSGRRDCGRTRHGGARRGSTRRARETLGRNECKCVFGRDRSGSTPAGAHYPQDRL